MLEQQDGKPSAVDRSGHQVEPRATDMSFAKRFVAASTLQCTGQKCVTTNEGAILRILVKLVKIISCSGCQLYCYVMQFVAVWSSRPPVILSTLTPFHMSGPQLANHIFTWEDQDKNWPYFFAESSSHHFCCVPLWQCLLSEKAINGHIICQPFATPSSPSVLVLVLVVVQ